MLALDPLLPMAFLAVGAWLASLAKNEVSIADSLWPLFILLAATTYAIAAPQTGPRTVVVVTLVAIWALRLAAHITWRSWGEPEDHRYKAMRARNEPLLPLEKPGAGVWLAGHAGLGGFLVRACRHHQSAAVALDRHPRRLHNCFRRHV